MIIRKTSYSVFLYVFALLMTINYGHSQTVKEPKKIHTTKNKTQLYREISGTIISSDLPLTNVNIRIKNTNRGTKTDSKGFYTLKAKEDEILLFTHIGMQSLEVIIEDITKVLNIKMRVQQNALDEVIVKTRKKQKEGFTEMDKPRKITTSKGVIDTRKVGYSVSYVDGEDLSLSASNLTQALQGKVAGMKVKTDVFGNESVTLRGGNTSILLKTNVIWDVDGMIFDAAPPLDLSNIKDVAIIRSLAGTNAYGFKGKGGVIVVRTKTATFDEVSATSKSKPYTNKNYYQEDALDYSELEFFIPNYLEILDTVSNSQQAYIAYQKMTASYGTLPDFYLNIATSFREHGNNLQASKVLSDMEIAFVTNPEALKAIAYTYQEQRAYNKAIVLYKKIIKLRPNHVQSFRDLANAYVDLKQYQNAWKVYMNYLYRGNKLDDSGIGQIMYHEMEAIYLNKKKIANIKESFELTGTPNELSNDIRMVFEWNSAEAEFELEFVNPQKQSYTFEHSYFANKDLIADEKLKGYSSKEFIIDDLTMGDWLVNISYFGNKKTTPTFLKMTIYYNWEKSNQTQKITLFKLTENTIKLQLLKLNKRLLAGLNR